MRRERVMTGLRAGRGTISCTVGWEPMYYLAELGTTCWLETTRMSPVLTICSMAEPGSMSFKVVAETISC